MVSTAAVTPSRSTLSTQQLRLGTNQTTLRSRGLAGLPRAGPALQEALELPPPAASLRDGLSREPTPLPEEPPQQWLWPEGCIPWSLEIIPSTPNHLHCGRRPRKPASAQTFPVLDRELFPLGRTRLYLQSYVECLRRVSP